jgi:hypothetical protein
MVAIHEAPLGVQFWSSTSMNPDDGVGRRVTLTSRL